MKPTQFKTSTIPIAALALFAAILLSTFPSPFNVASAEDIAPFWTGVQLVTAPDAILPRSLEVERSITASLHPTAPDTARLDGRAALLNFDGVVLVTLISLADDRHETYRVPRFGGGTMDIHHAQLIIGGTVLAFSPLSGTVLTTAPLLGVRRLLLDDAPSRARLQQEALQAADNFAEVARRRGESIGSRSRRAPIKRSLLGGVVLQAGSSDGVVPGLVVAAGDAAVATGCLVRDASQHEAKLDCSGPVPEHAMGQYVRPVGAGVLRYQVNDASISSAKAREVLAASLDADQTAVAYAASDRLAERGHTVLPPGGEDGQRSATLGVREFAARQGLTESELEKFSLRFPPPDVQLDVVVDGYNTAIVGSGPVKRQRVHKAWATVRDNHGKSAEGIGVKLVDEVEGWQVDTVQAADAREAVLAAVKCATSRLLGEKKVEECA